jgi:uncharacterized protein (DUF1800 family)
MLLDVSKDPAMLVWLDSNSNVKGRANENYARELMELFSLGIGHYTEQDIREAARAFTGWHTEDDKFDFVPGFHDDGPKTVLKQRGNWNGEDVVRIVLEQPACAEFLVRKLYRFFVSETAEPPATFLQPLADSFRKSDYDIAGVVKTILRSRHFFSAYAYRQRVKSPVEFVLGAVRANVPKVTAVSPATIAAKLEMMGQPLFAPPNVKGWPGGKNWLNTSTVLARHNFSHMVASGRWEGYNPQQFEFEPPQVEEADVAATVQADPDTPAPPPPPPPATPAPSAPGTKPVQAKVPEEPPPPVDLDPAAVVRREKLTDPAKIVNLLTDLLLQGDVTPAARQKLVAFLGEGKPKDRALDHRVRATVHAILAMPEYELA